MIRVHETYSAMQSIFHNPTVCLLFTSVTSLLITLNYRKPVSLSGPVFTFIHVLISSDFCIQFILPLERSPDVEKIRSTYRYACDADAACKSSAIKLIDMGASLSMTACFCCQKLNGGTWIKKLDPAWHSLMYWFSCDWMLSAMMTNHVIVGLHDHLGDWHVQ